MTLGMECFHCGSHRTEYEKVKDDPGYIICRACGRLVWMALETVAMPDVPPSDQEMLFMTVEMAPPPAKEKICVVCGKTFTGGNGRSVVCGWDCRKIRTAENHQKWRMSHNILDGRVCPICGTRWKPDGSSGQKICPKCREQKRRKGITLPVMAG